MAHDIYYIDLLILYGLLRGMCNMKYIYFQDAHVKGINPASRTDNYYESWIAKFKEILSLAKEKKVDAIIDGGDILDTPLVSTQIIDEILDLIEETGIPIYMMWGNHTLIGHHQETSKGTSLAHMFRRCKLLKNSKMTGDNDHYIRFIDYDHNIEATLKDDGISFPEWVTEKKLWKIAIVHAFVTPKPFLEQVLHVQAKDIKTDADLVLVAHYHAVWKKVIGKTTFLDIGCIGRCKISEADIKPSVLFLDTEKRDYEVIPLKSAKDGSTIFDLTKKQAEEDNEKEMETFINSLKDFKSQDLDLRGTIEYIGKQQNVSRPVIDRILEKLAEVK